MRAGSLRLGQELSSESDDSDQEEGSPQDDENTISMAFKRSSKMEEINEQIKKVNSSTKPLNINFLAGPIHGNLEGNLKVIQAGMTSFLKSIQFKPIDRLVISTGK